VVGGSFCLLGEKPTLGRGKISVKEGRGTYLTPSWGGNGHVSPNGVVGGKRSCWGEPKLKESHYRPRKRDFFKQFSRRGAAEFMVGGRRKMKEGRQLSWGQKSKEITSNKGNTGKKEKNAQVPSNPFGDALKKGRGRCNRLPRLKGKGRKSGQFRTNRKVWAVPPTNNKVGRIPKNPQGSPKSI